MCKYCDDETIIIKKDIISDGSWGWGGELSITHNQICDDTYGLFIDKRDETTYLRFAQLDDCGCLESGEKIEISFCPFCGKLLRSFDENKII